jgi:hypothetical protein
MKMSKVKIGQLRRCRVGNDLYMVAEKVSIPKDAYRIYFFDLCKLSGGTWSEEDILRDILVAESNIDV